MSRRFVNLVVENKTCNMYALHRLDVSKHLFYPSTTEAEEGHAAKVEKHNNNGSGGGKPKPLRIEKLRRLPAPIAGFESSAKDWCSLPGDMFVLLNGHRPGGEPGSRILHANSEGHAAIYNADTRTIVCVPDLANPKGPKPLTFVVPGTNCAGEEEERLFVLRSDPVAPTYGTNHHQCSLNFEVLCSTSHRISIDVEDLGGGGDDYGGHLFDLTGNLKWHPLPAPPLSGSGDNLVSSTLLDGGQTICVSSMSNGTLCFDMASCEWRRAGDWTLPFHGRGEHLPELETWVGFAPHHPHHLCSADLTVVHGHGPIPLQHVWEDFTPPPTAVAARFPGNVVRRSWVEWTAVQVHLVRLGSGRLCIVKAFEADQVSEGTLTVLVGVEVVRGGDGDLRMVRHKTKRFVFPGESIHCVL